jgi:hypothetical protein
VNGKVLGVDQDRLSCVQLLAACTCAQTSDMQHKSSINSNHALINWSRHNLIRNYLGIHTCILHAKDLLRFDGLGKMCFRVNCCNCSADMIKLFTISAFRKRQFLFRVLNRKRSNSALSTLGYLDTGNLHRYSNDSHANRTK